MKTTRFLLLMLLTFLGAVGLSAQTNEAYLEYNAYPNYQNSSTCYVTFYYDNKKSQWDEFEKIICPVTDDGRALTMPRAEFDYDEIHIIFDPSFKNYRPTNTSNWFTELECNDVIIFEGLENLNTSEVTNMSHMFAIPRTNAIVFNVFDLSHLYTSKVVVMSYMF